MTPSEPHIAYADFARVGIRVGPIVRAAPLPEARRPAHKVWVYFGALGIKKTSAQITGLYDPDDLVERQVLAVVNFPPNQIGPLMFEVLGLGAVLTDDCMALVRPDRPVPLSSRIV